MSRFTPTFSNPFFSAAIRVVTLALFLVVFGTGAAFAQGKGYAVNFLSDNVSVIDPATNTVVATVPVGSFPEFIAVTPNEDFAYVTNVGDGTVSVISAATRWLLLCQLEVVQEE